MELPKGLVSLPGDRHAVGAKVGIALIIVMWLGAVFLIGLGIVTLVVEPAGPPRENGDVPLWAPLSLAALGLLVGYWAWSVGRKPKFVIDDDGFHSQAIFGKAFIDWQATDKIHLSVPRGNALWFDAPGGIRTGSKISKKKRIQVPISGLRVNNRALHAYVLERARQARAGQTSAGH